MIKVLFFCAANSCRSPAAWGIFAKLAEAAGLADHFWLESAGTHADVGRPAHPETTRVAHARGIDITRHRSRPLHPGDFREFDYLFGMDSANIEAARVIAPQVHLHKVELFLGAAPPGGIHEVPDPFRTANGFEEVHSLLEGGARTLLERLRREHALP